MVTASSGCCLIVLFECNNGGCDLAAKGVDQRGHVLVTSNASERALCFEHACGDPACFFMEPSFHLVTLRVVRFAMEIIDSMQLAVVKGLFRNDWGFATPLN